MMQMAYHGDLVGSMLKVLQSPVFTNKEKEYLVKKIFINPEVIKQKPYLYRRVFVVSSVKESPIPISFKKNKYNANFNEVWYINGLGNHIYQYLRTRDIVISSCVCRAFYVRIFSKHFFPTDFDMVYLRHVPIHLYGWYARCSSIVIGPLAHGNCDYLLKRSNENRLQKMELRIQHPGFFFHHGDTISTWAGSVKDLTIDFQWLVTPTKMMSLNALHLDHLERLEIAVGPSRNRYETRFLHDYHYYAIMGGTSLKTVVLSHISVTPFMVEKLFMGKNVETVVFRHLESHKHCKRYIPENFCKLLANSLKRLYTGDANTVDLLSGPVRVGILDALNKFVHLQVVVLNQVNVEDGFDLECIIDMVTNAKFVTKLNMVMVRNHHIEPRYTKNIVRKVCNIIQSNKKHFFMRIRFRIYTCRHPLTYFIRPIAPAYVDLRREFAAHPVEDYITATDFHGDTLLIDLLDKHLYSKYPMLRMSDRYEICY